MPDIIKTIGNVAGAVFLIFALGLLVWSYPVTSAVVIGAVTAIIAVLTLTYDRDHWHRKYLLWRNPQVMATADRVAAQHEADLAKQMSAVLVSDGRWDYDWRPWQPIAERFVDDHVQPALTPAQRLVIERGHGPLRPHVIGSISSRVFARCQADGLLT